MTQIHEEGFIEFIYIKKKIRLIEARWTSANMAFPAPRRLVKKKAGGAPTHIHAAKPVGTACPNPSDVALGFELRL